MGAEESLRVHQFDDLNQGPSAHHHDLGFLPEQAAPGNFAFRMLIRDEGSDIGDRPAIVDFVGAGVTATAVGVAPNQVVTVTIPGGGGALEIFDESSSLTTAATSINFVGSIVTASSVGSVVTVTVNTNVEEVQDIVGALISGANGVTATYNDAGNVENLSLDVEFMQDQISSFLVAGTNITLSYSDASNQLTINATGGGGATVRDTVLSLGSQSTLRFPTARISQENASEHTIFTPKVAVETDFDPIRDPANAAAVTSFSSPAFGSPGDILLTRSASRVGLRFNSTLLLGVTGVVQNSGSPTLTVNFAWRHSLVIGDIISYTLGPWANGFATLEYETRVVSVPTSRSITITMPSNSSFNNTSVVLPTGSWVQCLHRRQTIPIAFWSSVGTTRTIVTDYPNSAGLFQSVEIYNGPADLNTPRAAITRVDNKTVSYIGPTSINRGSVVATVPSPAVSGTSLVVTAGEGVRFPATPFFALVTPASTAPIGPSLISGPNSEIIQVTAIATDTLTIVRAQQGSTARTILVEDRILIQEVNAFMRIGSYAEAFTPMVNTAQHSANGITLPNTLGKVVLPTFPNPVVPALSYGGHAVFPEEAPANQQWEVQGTLVYNAGPPPFFSCTTTANHSMATGGDGSKAGGEGAYNCITFRVKDLPTEAAGWIYAGYNTPGAGIICYINNLGALKISLEFTAVILATTANTTVVAGDWVVFERFGRRIVTSVWTHNAVTGHVKKAAGSLEALVIMNNDFIVASLNFTRPQIGLNGTTTGQFYAGRSPTQFINDDWGRVYV